MNEVKQAVINEYSRAFVRFGPINNSPHESYAVILEEFEEAQENAVSFQSQLESYWITIKGNKEDEAKVRLTAMKKLAEQAAAEWVQVAAMCHKAMITHEKQYKRFLTIVKTT